LLDKKSQHSFSIMIRALVCLLIVACATAFAPISPSRPTSWGVASRNMAPLAMFSGDNPKGLEEVNDAKSTTVMESSATTTTTEDESSSSSTAPKAVYRNLARGGEVTEVPWVDTEMAANTRPWEMSWWAYILWVGPIVLLANDFLHFLPKEGPLAFLGNL